MGGGREMSIRDGYNTYTQHDYITIINHIVQTHTLAQTIGPA